jgi:FdhD protein
MDPYIKRRIIKHKGKSSNAIEDYIAVEKSLNVFVNGENIINLYCTPLMIKELVMSLLVTEGILQNKISPEEITIVYGEEIKVEISVVGDISKEKLVTTRCTGGTNFNKKRIFKKITDNFSITVEDLKKVFNEFQLESEFFRLTGCFHSAALSDGKKIIVFAEDIGRHNAIDKVTGYFIFKDIPFSEKLMVVSCRISSGIVSRCSRFGIPIIASRAAPTDLAIDIAEASGITMIGFVRGESLNIYTNPQRILK